MDGVCDDCWDGACDYQEPGRSYCLDEADRWMKREALLSVLMRASQASCVYYCCGWVSANYHWSHWSTWSVFLDLRVPIVMLSPLVRQQLFSELWAVFIDWKDDMVVKTMVRIDRAWKELSIGCQFVFWSNLNLSFGFLDTKPDCKPLVTF